MSFSGLVKLQLYLVQNGFIIWSEKNSAWKDSISNHCPLTIKPKHLGLFRCKSRIESDEDIINLVWIKDSKASSKKVADQRDLDLKLKFTCDVILFGVISLVDNIIAIAIALENKYLYFTGTDLSTRLIDKSVGN